MIYLCLEIYLHSQEWLAHGKLTTMQRARNAQPHGKVCCAYLGWFERIVRREMNFDHEHTACIRAVGRSAEAQFTHVGH